MPAVCLIVSGGHTVLYEVSPAGPADPAAAHAVSDTAESARRATTPRAKPTTKSPSFWPGLSGRPGDRSNSSRRSASNSATTGGNSIRFGATKIKGNPYDFSFSGIKTAVLYYVRAHPELQPEIEQRREALARGERSAAELCLPLRARRR